MSKGVKIAIIIVVVIVALAILGYLLAKYTTVGMSYRVSRLHGQIETKYTGLIETYDESEAKEQLVTQLNGNRLLDSAEFDGDVLVLEYVDGTVEDYYLGQED